MARLRTHGGPAPRRARGVAAAATTLLAASAAAGLAVAAGWSALQRAFLELPPMGRRAAAQKALLLLAPAATLGLPSDGAHADAGDPLPPPLIKDLQRAAPKIQKGADWFYFELKPALAKEDLGRSRECLGSALKGSHVSPLETDMLLPMEQLLSANIDAEEDGWVDAVRKIAASVDTIKDQVGGGEWKEARASWEEARQSANKVMLDINARADKPYFVAMDGDYEAKRYDQYLQGKKDEIAYRNAAGTLAMR